MSEETESPYFWTLVDRFFRAELLYRAQHDLYEQKVASFVESFGKPRDQIRLDQEQLSGLLDFKRLEQIRDSYLLPLKKACHRFFRSHKSTDFLDRLVNDIFHELSILKEEHYNVLTYSEESERDDGLALEELRTIFDEVHEMFPIKVHRLLHLFERARVRMEAMLPRYNDNAVLIRSLFLNRDDFVAHVYPDGLLGFYRILYGESCIFEGFRVAGNSFYHAGFYEQAAQAFSAGEEYLHGIPPHGKRRLDGSWKDAREHFKRYTRNCKDRLVSLEED